MTSVETSAETTEASATNAPVVGYLKLVGLTTFNSLDTGIVRKGEVVHVTNEDRFDELKNQGVQIGDEEDGYFKPYFLEVSKPTGTKGGAGKRRVLTEAEIDALDKIDGKQSLIPGQDDDAEDGNENDEADGKAAKPKAPRAPRVRTDK